MRTGTSPSVTPIGYHGWIINTTCLQHGSTFSLNFFDMTGNGLCQFGICMLHHFPMIFHSCTTPSIIIGFIEEGLLMTIRHAHHTTPILGGTNQMIRSTIATIPIDVGMMSIPMKIHIIPTHKDFVTNSTFIPSMRLLLMMVLFLARS